MRKLFFILVLTAVSVVWSSSPAFENVGTRGLVALPQDGGQVWMSWRLLESDTAATGFDVYRKVSGGSYVKINSDPIMDSTNYKDTTTTAGTTYIYMVKPVVDGVEGLGSNEATVTAAATGRNYIRINKHSETIYTSSVTPDINRMAMGDLDGDGIMDYICRSYNLASWDIALLPTTPVYFDAYSGATGTRLWRFNSGGTPQLGNGNYQEMQWPHACLAWDLDNDGNAEVITFRPNGTYYYDLLVLDGLTGTVKKSYTLEHFAYDEGRHMIGIAYLDGQTPSIIVNRGTYLYYGGCRLYAFDKDLNLLWRYFAPDDGSHRMAIADADGDGNDEILSNDVLVDEYGQTVWAGVLVNGARVLRGHSDNVFIADIDPDSPGLEAYYTGEAPWYPIDESPDSWVWLSRLSDGQQLWGDLAYNDACAGLVGDTTLDYAGWECCAADEEGMGAKGYTCKGVVLASGGFPNEPDYNTGVFGPGGAAGVLRFRGKATHDMYYMYYSSVGGVAFYPIVFDEYGTTPNTHANLLASSYRRFDNYSNPWIKGDLLGDYREEMVMESSSWTYFIIAMDTTVLTNREVTPLQDRKYRGDMSRYCVGYTYHATPYKGGYGFPLPPGEYSVQGAISRQSEPVFDIDLTLAGSAGSRVTKTSVSGTYSFNFLQADNYQVTPAKQHYTFAPSSRQVTVSNAHVSGVDFAATWTLPVEPTITAATGKAYDLRTGVTAGFMHYIDRTYTIASVPSAYSNCVWIRTAMDDKLSTLNPLITFQVNTEVEVYVGSKNGITPPTWLGSWTATGQSIVASHLSAGDTTFNLYKKTFAAGTVQLGPNSAECMYIVLLKAPGASAPQLSVSPAGVDFGTADTQKTIAIGNTGSASLTWTLSESASWLSADTAGGTLATGQQATVTLTADRAGLEAGAYDANITIASDGGTQTVAATMTVLGPAQLWVTPFSVAFGAEDTVKTISVGNVGGGSLGWSLSESAAWLSASSSNGTLAAGQQATVTLTVSRNGLNSGIYNADVSITSDGGNQNVAVAMEVVAGSAWTITGLTVASGQSYQTAWLVEGGQHYIDRTYTITDIPDAYEGRLWIRTAMADKTATANPFITFTSSKDLEAVIAIVQGQSIPSWLSDWEACSEVITANHSPYGTITFALYKKSFAAGQITLGPCAGTSSASMYLVLLKELTTEWTISNLTTAGSQGYQAAHLVEGDQHYIDRTYTIASVPTNYAGRLWIRTAMADKTATANPFISFISDRDVEAVIAIVQGQTPPSWMSDWETCSETIAGNHSPYGMATFALYKKTFAAGQIALGPCAGVSSNSMYLVLLKGLEPVEPEENPFSDDFEDGIVAGKWLNADIGTTVTGSTLETNGEMAIQGCGTDIYYNADSFRYVYQRISGDCEVALKVTSVPATDAFSKSGLMIRQNTGAGSPYVSALVSRDNGLRCQRRLTADGATTREIDAAVAAPVYVGISRVGDNFEMFKSADGQSWTQVGSTVTLAMTDPVLVGIAVCAHTTSTLGTSVVDDFTVTGGEAPPE